MLQYFAISILSIFLSDILYCSKDIIASLSSAMPTGYKQLHALWVTWGHWWKLKPTITCNKCYKSSKTAWAVLHHSFLNVEEYRNFGRPSLHKIHSSTIWCDDDTSECTNSELNFPIQFYWLLLYYVVVPIKLYGFNVVFDGLWLSMVSKKKGSVWSSMALVFLGRCSWHVLLCGNTLKLSLSYQGPSTF